MTTRQKRKALKDVVGATMMIVGLTGICAMFAIAYHYDNSPAVKYCHTVSHTPAEFNRCMAIDEIGK